MTMSANSSRIEQLRDATKNDAETLALIFEDTQIKDDGSIPGRLRAILDATERKTVPGLQTAIAFHDSGFKDVFKDPWPSSDNQVGHFLTAVGLRFKPAKVSETMMGRRLRDWLGAPDSMTDAAVAVRLVVGHEKAPDPTLAREIIGAIVGEIVAPWSGPGGAAGGTAVAILTAFRNQFAACTDADVTVFENAERDLGTKSQLDLTSANARLRSISVVSTNQGNSYQDLLLSLCGWLFGRLIGSGKFTSRGAAADWIRTNIEA
jgi:hypothetical protein